MKNKLNKESGLTVVEMLAATAVLVLLVMMLGTGLQMAVDGYRKITAQYEADLLLSNAMDALADDLRFARNVWYLYDADGVIDGFSYRSDSFGTRIRLEVDDITTGTGQILAIDTTKTSNNRKSFLSTGSYGFVDSNGKRAYVVTGMDIELHEIHEGDNTFGTFTIDLEVATDDDGHSIKASGKVTVRCLNRLDDLYHLKPSGP